MRYARHKKPLVIALFLIFTVSMALVSKNVAYAEETVEPSIARDKICKAAGLTTTKKLQGNKDEGYWCGAPDG
ncbi:MAG: hypothetical protein D8G53_03620, partial [Candidatus Saccharimonas sp.]